MDGSAAARTGRCDEAAAASAASATARPDKPGALVISSVHDFRTKRRASIQALASALARNGYRTRFLSIRFSPLSILKGDGRLALWSRANRPEWHDGIECYLWRTPFHPFASAIAGRATAGLHDIYANWPNPDVDAMIADSSVVIVESGLGVALLPRIRRINPDVRLIYRAADALDTIGAHPHLQHLLERYRDMVDHYALLARPMARQFDWAREKTYFVGPALDPADFADPGASPYECGARTAVSVGSMLFDPDFFELAAPRFPDITFVVIGCGQRLSPRQNVVVLPEMKFRDTVPYLAHADIGLAPYRPAASADYLGESSLKLTQYAYLRRPAVCPHFAVGGRSDRFGYEPGEAAEIEAALSRALETRIETAPPVLDWDGALARLLEPRDFPDTRIEAALFEKR